MEFFGTQIQEFRQKFKILDLGLVFKEHNNWRKINKIWRETQTLLSELINVLFKTESY